MSATELISTAIRKIVEYRIVASINTGDRTLDNLINTLFLAFIAALFAPTLWIKVRMYYYMWNYSRKSYTGKKKNSSSGISSTITLYNYTYYADIINDKKMSLMYTAWSYGNYNAEFTKCFSNYMQKNFAWKLGSNTHIYTNMKTMVSTDMNGETSPISKSITSDTIFPIYICKNNNLIGLTKKAGGTDINIAYESIEDLTEFRDMILTYDVKKEIEDEKKDNIPIQRNIRFMNKERTSTLYVDRTFDMIVTRHKPHILNALKDLQISLEGKSQFNGYGSYNLGFMLYGKPGTGKTSIIKAICNYLGRDAYIIDMRSIKTTKILEDKFYNLPEGKYTKFVYVLEEFDCVQGVLSRTIDEKDNKSTDEKTRLNERYMQILTIQSQMTDKDSKAGLITELEEIRKSLREIEERLTIDTILTTLDGPDEMRGRVIIATTNHIDRIDSALLREGRFDLKIELREYVDEEIREMLIKMFTGNASVEDMDYIASKKYKDDEFTPVQIINLCHKYQSLRKVVDILSVK